MMTNIGFGSLPPSGSAGIYTTVIADHPGGVLIDAQQTNTPIYFYGSYASRDGQTGSGTNVSYIAIHGLIAANPHDNGNSNGCITLNNAHHIKIIDCGAVEADAYTTPISINRSGYLLVEGCYSWGQGRMRIVSYLSDYTIFRRNVVRADYVNVIWPFGMIDLYADQHTRVQNNIVIDSDQFSSYTYGTTAMGAFIDDSGALNGTSWAVHLDNIMWNNIALNNDMGLTSQQGFTGADPASFNNMIAWDMRAISNTSGGSPASPIIYAPANLNINQATFGHWRSPHAALATDSGTGISTFDSAWASGFSETITNTIFYDLLNYGNAGAGLFDINITANYNNVYGVANIISGGSPTVTNTITTNPTTACLKYLPRIEAGCALQTAGLSGARVGANVVNMRGKSGTLWGETGYDTDYPSVSMWPFPHEDLIKTQMQTYNLHGVSGNRGFASSTATSLDGSSQTLTKYIWEYLGNQIPAGIYNISTTPADKSPAITVLSSSPLN
jgi:hypothetical protein